MKRFGIALGLALTVASLASIGCTASSTDEEVETEEVKKSEGKLSCNRSAGGCTTLERYCANTGRTMYCTLDGRCWCA